MNFFRRSKAATHEDESPSIVIRSSRKGYWMRCDDCWRPRWGNGNFKWHRADAIGKFRQTEAEAVADGFAHLEKRPVYV